ncbi:hypothetical protein B7760_05869 (plasmid) [Burkholderia glumae]|nr:hypothetical protein B7760_05869 [Burkholderia glumae]
MSKKTKPMAQLPYRTREWAEARLKEVPGCPIAEKVTLATEVAKAVSFEDRPKRVRKRL